jgi:hypothetical protein
MSGPISKRAINITVEVDGLIEPTTVLVAKMVDGAACGSRRVHQDMYHVLARQGGP